MHQFIKLLYILTGHPRPPHHHQLPPPRYKVDSGTSLSSPIGRNSWSIKIGTDRRKKSNRSSSNTRRCNFHQPKPITEATTDRFPPGTSGQRKRTVCLTFDSDSRCHSSNSTSRFTNQSAANISPFRRKAKKKLLDKVKQSCTSLGRLPGWSSWVGVDSVSK